MCMQERHSACLLHPLCPQAITNMTGFPVECASLAPAWQVDASWINDQVGWLFDFCVNGLHVRKGTCDTDPPPGIRGF